MFGGLGLVTPCVQDVRLSCFVEELKLVDLALRKNGQRIRRTLENLRNSSHLLCDKLRLVH